MNKTQMTLQERISAAYEWLINNPSKSLQQAAMRFNINDKILTRELRQKYNYSAAKALADRQKRHFEELCKLWPQVKHDLDNTDDRAIAIMRKYGHGQHALNALTVHFKYDIEVRAQKIREKKRAITMGVKKQVKPIEISGVRYMALCMPWSKAA